MNKILLNGLDTEGITIALQMASEGDYIHLKYQCKDCTISIFADDSFVGVGMIDMALRSVDDTEWIATEYEKRPIIPKFPIKYFPQFIQRIKELDKKDLLKVWEIWETGDWLTDV